MVALVLVDGAVAPFPLSWWERIAIHPLIWIPLLRVVGSNRLVHMALPHVLREPPIADGWDVYELSRHLGNPRRRHVMQAYYRAFLSRRQLASTERDLAELHVPVLLLRGAHDHVLPNSLMGRIVEALPSDVPVEARRFPVGGHLLPIEEPDLVAHAIDEFVVSLPRLRA